MTTTGEQEVSVKLISANLISPELINRAGELFRSQRRSTSGDDADSLLRSFAYLLRTLGQKYLPYSNLLSSAGFDTTGYTRYSFPGVIRAFTYYDMKPNVYLTDQEVLDAVASFRALENLCVALGSEFDLLRIHFITEGNSVVGFARARNLDVD